MVKVALDIIVVGNRFSVRPFSGPAQEGARSEKNEFAYGRKLVRERK